MLFIMRAASRAPVRAGRRMPMSRAMMLMTTNSSIRVKARFFMGRLR